MKSFPFRLWGLVALVLFAACADGPREEDLANLTGYWEIEQVVFPDGAEKKYQISTTIEYLEWDGREGFRKKMQPTLEGTYLTSDDALPMQVLWRDGRLFLKFDGSSQSWEEEVKKLQPAKMILLHSNGLRYEYKKYEPLTIEKDSV